MNAATGSTPLLDGPMRSVILGVVMVVLMLVTVDGVMTWLEAEDARDVTNEVVDANAERYPTGIDDHGQLLSAGDRATIAARTDGDRLDRDLVTTKTWLAVIGIIAAVALTIASGPGSSRNVLAASIIVAAGAFFVPLAFHSDTIDIITTAHGG